MEALAPPLDLLISVRFGIEKGQSLKRTLQQYIDKNRICPWRQSISLWVNILEMGRSPGEVTKNMSVARKQVLDLLEQGLRGEPIFSQVCSMEEELFESSELEIQEFLATLPIKTLLPLLFCQFPAFLLLLLGPFLEQFLAQT